MPARRAPRPRPPSGAFALVVLGWLSASGVPGCEPRAPASLARHRCSCSFRTDYDDAALAEVEACAADPEHAAAVARSCAQRAAPGVVERCACARAPAPTACPAESCAPVVATP
ncbi:MAG: hypothetical protein IT373_22420 [Polyangiaceae bacterium]|nr:hypothetical protein [Polyangiaceae bacterium]